MLREAKHLEGERERPFAAAQGDAYWADKAALGAMNRPLRMMRSGLLRGKIGAGRDESAPTACLH